MEFGPNNENRKHLLEAYIKRRVYYNKVKPDSVFIRHLTVILRHT